MPDDRKNIDPYGGHYFALRIDVETLGEVAHYGEVAHFMECSGLKSSTTVFEIEEGGVNSYTHKRPGQAKWENLVLKYATSVSTSLMDLRDRFLRDQFSERWTGEIVLMTNNGDEVRRYEFRGAWPVSWEGPQLNAGSSELAIETLELAHEGLTVHAN